MYGTYNAAGMCMISSLTTWHRIIKHFKTGSLRNSGARLSPLEGGVDLAVVFLSSSEQLF